MVSRLQKPDALAATRPSYILSRMPVLTVLVLGGVLGAPVPAYAAEGAGNPIVELAARLLNFGILACVLVYFLKAPIAGYLASRSTQIRQDLVTAAEMRSAATAHLAEID